MLRSRALVLSGALLALSARAENLVSVREGALPAPPGTAAITCLIASDQPLAVRDGTVWRYDPPAQQWTKASAVSADRLVRGSIAHGARPWFLLGPAENDVIDRVERYASGEGSATAHLTPVPTPLVSAQGAVLGDTLHLAGIDARGAAQWWSLDLSAAQPQWKIHPAWAATARRVSAVVALDASLVLATPNAAGTADELWRWTAADGWHLKATLPGTVVDGAARAVGQAHALFLVRLPADATTGPRLQLHTFHTTTGAISPQGAAV